MILLTLVSGASAARREAAIAARVATLVPDARIALILEGPAPSTDVLAGLAAADGRLMLNRIASGCPCCTGNLTLRVTLDRMVRRRPTQLFLSIASDAHLAQLRRFLRAPPYDGHLALTEDLLPADILQNP